MINKEKIELAVGDYKFFSLSNEHSERMDVWLIETIGDEAITISSVLYGLQMNINYKSLSDKKKPESILDELRKLFIYFASGLETGVNLTKTALVSKVEEIYNADLINKENEKEDQVQPTGE
jgi:hypothetical protein